VDSAGNAVSVTYTLNNWFGAQRVAGDTGILMNDEMDDFTSKLDVPNMSPTIVTKDGKLVMVIGSPGGSRIITITLEAIINVIDHGMTIQEAIDAPRIWHDTERPSG
jgi:gamma-glutamyltranspeptidase/glutathione hydrolase